MSRTDLVGAFRDTMNHVKKDAYIRRMTEEAAENTRVYTEGHVFEMNNEKSTVPHISVTPNSTFLEASLHKASGKRIAVLNFANGTHPGGGVTRGAMAQEECLCRSSNLYPVLKKKSLKRDYYDYNRKNAPYLSTDRIVYSKDVLVFKNDSYLPEMLEREDFFTADVITCAAPINTGYDDAFLYDMFYKRIRQIAGAAAENGADILVFGAFGCGAFDNPPKIVSQAFYDVIVRDGLWKYFEKTVFAVKTDMKRPSLNYTVFYSRFMKGEENA